MPILNPSVRIFTTYVKPSTFYTIKETLQIWFMADRTKGQRFVVVFTIPKTAFAPVEWLDEPSAEWRSLPLTPFKHKVKSVKGLLDGWRKAVSIVQLLEGITWTEPRNGLETLSLGAREVRELKIDHSQQTCRWVPRKAKGLQPAPALASWDENFKLMVEQFGNGFTIVGCDPPDIKDKFWSALGVDLAWQTLDGVFGCDFCKYSESSRKIHCARYPNRTDTWVCTRCSKMNRPCTYTPRSVSLELWGDDPPYLGRSSSGLLHWVADKLTS
ncbi:hypothetical protein FPSE_06611 [Fusarium pseudograminearum CS3096]|uniref:Zn(2)-C6 fungal-type domain-containing protein n=1 Tax=Fusarium pseudograminearum (strain CS3096) TaxID=1028729 RepID=K3VG09_FUSPC|nr:hypothetical protein FPSE_06611 [Fusarium pseudograminearum CS3096]EKJ73187.1 hypothetical protein FPSE_06611 [Fusarium pseudograminearum CS3096]